MFDKKFKVIVRNTEKLFQQIQKPNRTHHDMFEGNSHIVPYQLGGAALSVPMDKVNVSCMSNGKEFNLSACIGSARKPEEGPHKLFDHYSLNIPKNLDSHFPIEAISEEVSYILDDNKEPEFAVTKESFVLFHSIRILVGSESGFDSVSTPPKTLTTLEQFEKDIKKFAKIIEVVINGIYESEGKDSPNSTLYLQPSIAESNIQSESSSFGVATELLKKAIEVKKPEVSFTEVGGLNSAKREIQGLSFALKNPELYKKWGTKPPKGILLYGPPGTGKTLLAKALASEAEAKFYHVKVSDITSKWYGQSEKLMQGVFDIAKQNGPSIIFFDEIDALASKRDESHEATQRILSVMLENLDGLEASENVMAVASTNRPDVVDPALKRPGRIDRLVEVPMPDEKARKQIFSIHIAKAEKIAERKLFKDLDFTEILGKTNKMSGADIAEIIRRALEEKVRKEGTGGKPALTTTEDILQEIETYERIKTSLKPEEIEKWIL